MATKRRTSAGAASVVAAILLVVTPTAQAAPSNDDFANAHDLGNGATASVSNGSNVDATKEVGEPDHAGDPGGASIWYRWTPPSSGQVRIHSCGSDFDTLVAVYTGAALGSLTEIASNDQGCGNQSRAVFDAVAGVTYRIAVDGWSNGGQDDAATGAITLDLGPPTPPANDDFANATNLGSSLDVSIGGSSIDATKEVGEPAHAGDPGGASVWYRWTSLNFGRVKIDVCDSRFDTLLAVYTGTSLGDLSEVASNDQACRNQSKVAFAVIPATTYWIAIDGWSDGGSKAPDQGEIELRLQEATPPANDDFAAATNLGSTSATTFGVDTSDATKEPGEPNHAGDPGGASAWYRWTAPSSGPVRINACDSFFGFDTLIGVYTGSSVSALTPIAGNDDSCAFGLSRVVFIASAGTTYRIAVDGWSSGGNQAAQEGFVNVELKVLNPPANDNFANALNLGSFSNAASNGTNVDATKEEGEPWAYFDDHDSAYDEPGGASVWYRWTAPTSGWFTFDACESNFETTLAVFTGSGVTALNRVADSAASCRSPGALTAFQTTAGTTYRIMVDGSTYRYFQPPEEGTFAIRIYPTTGIPPFPVGAPTQTSSSPWTTASQSKKRKKCRKGFKLKRIKKKRKRGGKRKCVKKKKQKRKRN